MDQFAILEGSARTGPIYFLPWRTGFGLAQKVGLIPNSAFAACYRLPDDVVCPNPLICAARIGDMVDIAVRRARLHDLPRAVVGYSMGTVPATLVAAALGVPLWSFASADRGDLMIWSSPAARTVQRDAVRMGFSRNDFSIALRNLNPIDSIHSVHRDSRIVVGRFDRLVPRARSQALAERARRYLPTKNVVELPLGHLGVLGLSPWLQRRWMAG
ncbi:MULTISPECIES: hypothetical protein [unclassified Bradyrhizobium]|uniref:hypothetical protein n=1 Tax=unclassified Bradyrhizobium TaxID=2631580 RepID=UPI0023B0120E|nr:hypothetical protein [Bradyrhizobium sp. CSS354]MDE5459927.1 hypothetical protein [Bradyrhizobium sp. CSS354]